MNRLTQWIIDAYRGFMWPYVTFLLGAGYVGAQRTHTWWHYLAWPVLAAGITTMNIAASKIAKARKQVSGGG